jgi:hypothetical protein
VATIGKEILPMNKSVRNAIVRLFLAGALFTAVATQLFAAEFICGSNGVLYMWTGYGWVVSGHCAPSTL